MNSTSVIGRACLAMALGVGVAVFTPAAGAACADSTDQDRGPVRPVQRSLGPAGAAAAKGAGGRPQPAAPVASPLSWAVLAASRRQIGVVRPAAATAANQPPAVTGVAVGAPNPATGAVTGSVNAVDPDGDRVSFAAKSSPKGTVGITAAGIFTYTPTATARHAAAKVGAGPAVTTDSVTFTVTDASGSSSGAAVTVPISPKNAAPVPKITVGAPNASTGVVTGAVTATDADGDTRTYTGSGATAKGTVSVNSGTGAFTFTPTVAARHNAAATTASAADKTDSFTVTVSDGYGAVVPVTVTVGIGPKNTAPTATATVAKPDAVSGVATGNVKAVDTDGDVFTYTATQPANGTVTVNADGSFTYTPTAAIRANARASTAAKTDTFVVTVSDGHGGTRAVTVTALIAPADAAPVAGTPAVGSPDPTLGTVTGTVVASDPDADPLTFTLTNGTATAKGSVSISATGQFSYTPSLIARRSAPAVDTFDVTVTDRYGASTVIAVTVPVSPAAVVPLAEDYVLIRKADLMTKPTSGPGWEFLRQEADSNWAAPNLSTLNTTVQTSALAAALVYARTGDASYRDKVIAAIRKVPGTETNATVVLPFARNLFGYVVAADLVGMPLDTVCDNGQTWRAFLETARTKKFNGNARWVNLEVTSGDSASNWNAYALSTHLAVSIVLGDDAAVQRDVDIYRRFLGDVTSPWPAFNPTSGYLWNNNGRTWDLSPTLQRGINPSRAGDARSGAIILDASRHTTLPSVRCCRVDLAGRAYVEESLDGLLAIAMVLRAQGSDFTGFQDQALRRAYEFLSRNGGPSGYSNGRFLALAINNWFGTSFPTMAGDSVARHLGFGGWLFSR